MKEEATFHGSQPYFVIRFQTVLQQKKMIKIPLGERVDRRPVRFSFLENCNREKSEK